MAPKIAPSFCWVKISKTLRFPTPKDDLLSYTLANQNLVQSDWNLGEFFGITFKILGDRIWRENKNKVTSYRDYPPPSHPKCKDPKLSPKLIYLSQSHSESSFQAAKKTLSESWEVHVSPIQRVWDRNRLPAWNEPTWQLRPGEKVEILEDFESRSAKKHSNNRSTNTKKTQINTCCWPQEFLEIRFFCELCWGSEAFCDNRRHPGLWKKIWFDFTPQQHQLMRPQQVPSDPRGHKNHVQPTWRKCLEFAISAYFAGLLTQLQQKHG